MTRRSSTRRGVTLTALAVVAAGAIASVASATTVPSDTAGTETSVAGSAAPSAPAAAAEPIIPAACADVDLSTPPDEPVTFRLGTGSATEENYWYTYTDPEGAGAQYYGTWYDVEATVFNPTDRLDAYQAGAIDGGTMSTPQLVTAVGAGLPISAVASIATESSAEGAFNTTYIALEGSEHSTLDTLEGATIGIVAFNTATDWWARSAVASVGLDPERDVEYAVIPFPEQAALRNGTIDIAVTVQPFTGAAFEAGGVVEVFNALTGPGVDHELLVAWFDTAFIENNTEAYCAWLSDYTAATNAFLDNREAAATVLVDAGLLTAPDIEAYVAREDFARRRNVAMNLADTEVVIENMVEVGFIPADLGVTAGDLVLDGYSVVED